MSRLSSFIPGRAAAGTEDVRVLGDAGLHFDRPCRLLLHLEKGSARLGRTLGTRSGVMPLATPITDLEQLKDHPALSTLLAWNPAAVQGVKFDRDEMTIVIDRLN